MMMSMPRRRVEGVSGNADKWWVHTALEADASSILDPSPKSSRICKFDGQATRKCKKEKNLPGDLL